jgi:hypothetical protein
MYGLPKSVSILGSDTTCSEDSCDQRQLIVQIIAVNGLSGTVASGRFPLSGAITELYSGALPCAFANPQPWLLRLMTR